VGKAAAAEGVNKQSAKNASKPLGDKSKNDVINYLVRRHVVEAQGRHPSECQDGVVVHLFLNVVVANELCVGSLERAFLDAHALRVGHQIRVRFVFHLINRVKFVGGRALRRPMGVTGESWLVILFDLPPT